MQKLEDDFGAVAAIVVLALLSLVTMTLGGVFNGLSDGQAAFLGTLAGASIGFIGLLAGALFNARLNRQVTRQDEAKRALTCLMMLHARTRAFATSLGLLARLMEATRQVTVDAVESFELAAKSMRPDEFQDLRLVDPSILSHFHDLNSHIEGTRFSSIGPIKLCEVKDGVYKVDGAFLGQFVGGLGALYDDAIALRKHIASHRKVVDLGATAYSDIKLQQLYNVNPPNR